MAPQSSHAQIECFLVPSNEHTLKIVIPCTRIEERRKKLRAEDSASVK